MDASGVIGPIQKYTFTAQCAEEHTKVTKTLTWTGMESSSLNNDVGVTVEGKASWERATGRAKESLHVSGDASGERFTTAICSQDPFLRDPPGKKGTCDTFESQYQGEAGPAYQFFLERAFFLARTVSFVEAEALSKQKPPPNSPPPPPTPAGKTPQARPTRPRASTSRGGTMTMPAPALDNPKPGPPKLMSAPSGAKVWEGEDLLATSLLPRNGGQVGPQAMRGFPGEWTGGSQLLWTGGQTGAVLDLRVVVPSAGRYSVSLALTQGPDYGIFQAEFDGQPSELKFDGFSSNVRRVDRIDVGTFQLAPGPRMLSLMIIGKNSQSTGTLVGIDRITLTPVREQTSR
jgi:hypothetical protein